MTTPCSALGYGGDPLEATYNQDVTTHVALLGAVAITALVVGAGFSEEPPPTPPPTWPGCRALGAEDKPAVVARHRTRRSRAASAPVLSGTSVILRHEKSISRKQFEISPKRDAVVEALIDLTVEHIDKKMSESVRRVPQPCGRETGTGIGRGDRVLHHDGLQHPWKERSRSLGYSCRAVP